MWYIYRDQLKWPSSIGSDANKDMLNSVYLMRRLSLISNVFSTSYLSIFLYIYNVNIIFYLPLFVNLMFYIRIKFCSESKMDSTENIYLQKTFLLLHFKAKCIRINKTTQCT